MRWGKPATKRATCYTDIINHDAPCPPPFCIAFQSLWSQITKHCHHCKCWVCQLARIKELHTEQSNRICNKSTHFSELQDGNENCTGAICAPWNRNYQSIIPVNAKSYLQQDYIQWIHCKSALWTQRTEYSNETMMPIALVNTSGSKQYPSTLAVRRKFTPVNDMRFRMKCKDNVPNKINP